MTRQNRLASQRFLQGFSLIELMVSLVIGLLILTAAFSAYLGASGAGKAAEAQGRMNEDAQVALTILAQQLRMAGNNPHQSGRSDSTRRNPVYTPYDPTVFSTTPAVAPSAYSLRGCKGNFDNLATAISIDTLTCGTQSVTSPDSIAVSYEADAENSIESTDCVGARLTGITISNPPGLSKPLYYVANNLFYIDTPASTRSSPSLYCKGNGKINGTNSIPQPLVENIEDMQITYGAVAAGTVASGIKTMPIVGYLKTDKMFSGSPIADLSNEPERWARVISVRICVLVRSAEPVATDAVSARYVQCDGSTNTAPPDLRLRRAYHATVVLRNRRP